MHYVAGLTKQKDGNFYDCVIPNYYDPLDFKLETNKDDYFLYIGRLIKRKGVEVALQVCKELNKKLIIAGQGVIEYKPGYIKTNDFILEYENLEYAGVVGVEERNKLMGKAKALLVPTLYFGPFEGVSVESLFCGTPIITTNFGCFTENNIHGKTGYRCNTFNEFIKAAENIDKIDTEYCRKFAINNFSIYEIQYKYQEYFEQLLDLWEGGWYQRSDKSDYLLSSKFY
jgi:glycosyltransferase involved in cell wall biosynthesis